MSALGRVIALSQVREYDRRTRSGGMSHVSGYSTFTEKVKRGLAILHSSGKAAPYDNEHQKAQYHQLTPKGQDLYQGLRSLGASHRVAYGRALAAHGRRPSLLERMGP